MPHQCTDCGRQFDDGSKEMLSGCPDCGGNKFQFHPEGVDEPDGPAEPPDPPEADVGMDGSVAKTVGSAATAVRDLVGSSPDPPAAPEGSAAPEPTVDDGTEPVAAPPAGEDTAQASARTDVVSPDELPPAPDTPATTNASRSQTPQSDGPAAAADSASGTETAAADERDRPDLSDLRAELNDQFESIKVLEPGQYELNLMELYDREEYIVALQEDGKYTIQVPDRWQDD